MDGPARHWVAQGVLRRPVLLPVQPNLLVERDPALPWVVAVVDQPGPRLPAAMQGLVMVLVVPERPSGEKGGARRATTVVLALPPEVEEVALLSTWEG